MSKKEYGWLCTQSSRLKGVYVQSQRKAYAENCVEAQADPLGQVPGLGRVESPQNPVHVKEPHHEDHGAQLKGVQAVPRRD